MTVTNTLSTSAEGTNWVRSNGTIREVLNELSETDMSADNVVYWTDDGSTATTIYCRQK